MHKLLSKLGYKLVSKLVSQLVQRILSIGKLVWELVRSRELGFKLNCRLVLPARTPKLQEIVEFSPKLEEFLGFSKQISCPRHKTGKSDMRGGKSWYFGESHGKIVIGRCGASSPPPKSTWGPENPKKNLV